MKVTGCSRPWASRTRPISASSTEAQTWTFFSRSGATTNRTGVWNWAATVWPASTWRSITMPSTGDLIWEYARLVGRFQGGFALADHGLGQKDLGFERLAVAHVLLVFGLGQGLLLQQRQRPPLVGHGQLQQGLDALQVRPAVGQRGIFVGHRGLVGLRIDLGQKLPGVDLGIEVHKHVLVKGPETKAPTWTLSTGFTVPLEWTRSVTSPRCAAAVR